MNEDSTTTSSRPGGASPPAGGLKVLVVEDDAGDRWYLSEILRARGYTVVACHDGETGWSAFRQDPPPLVMLDLALPGMDGLEVCRRIRAHPGGSDTIVVAVTGRDDAGALETILEAGADDFVPKPLDPTLLDVRLAIAERRMRALGEHRRTDRALQSKTRDIEAFFQNVHEVFFSLDLDERRLLQVSPATNHLLARSPEELMAGGAAWARYFLPPADADAAWAELRETTGGPVTWEYAVALPGGDERWVRATLRPALEPEGPAHRAHGVLSDTTEERRARVELARRNEELDALHRISEVSLTAISLEEAYGEILQRVRAVLGTPIVAIERVDRERDRLATAATLGPSPGGAGGWETPVHGTLSGRAVQTGRPVVETDPKVVRDRGPEALSSLRLRLYAAFPLVSGNRVDGTLVLASSDPVPWDDRRTALAANLAHSVAAYTERIEAEQALRESEARYRALAEQLQQANQELESFAYSVSHDLRAPLRTMQGFAHALVQDFGDRLGPEARDYVRRVIASGRRMEDLIADLLAYSRLSFEELPVRSVELGGVVDAALEQVGADLDESGARVEVRRPLPTVLGHQTTLVRVVANLLANAVKFVAPDRAPEVVVRGEERGRVGRLLVEDNGIGVPEGQEERIFRVFERLGEGGDRPGTGIGLAVVRRGMQRIGGACGVERRQGRGSVFWIEAPLASREG